MSMFHPSTAPTRLGCAILAVLALVLLPLRAADSIVPVITQCSPSVVVLHSVAAGDCMTVHTDLRFRDVDTARPVALNGLVAYAVFSDSRGYLVAKFDLTKLRTLLSLPTTTLTLRGFTDDGSAFVGSDLVRVIK
jgi:hypothetical protein